MMLKKTFILFLTCAAGTAFAGTDGYLRYCDPLTLRFADPLLSAPPVNELILAMDDEPLEAETEPEAELPVMPGEELFNSPVIQELITGNLPNLNPVPVEPEPFTVSAGPEQIDIQFPDIPVPTPNTPQTEARTMQDILLMFTGEERSGKRGGKGPVVGIPLQVPPAIFNPPQSPAGTSKSTYIVE